MREKNNIHLPEGEGLPKKMPKSSDKTPHFPGKPNIPKEPKR